jgi:hypothetical protein
VPDDYLSFLTTLPFMKAERWRWLRDSIVAELKFRGLRYDLVDTEDVTVDPEVPAIRKGRAITLD